MTVYELPLSRTVCPIVDGLALNTRCQSACEENDHANRRADLILMWGKRPAERDSDAEHVEVIAAHQLASEHLRSAVRVERHRDRSICRQPLECAAVAQIEVVGIGGAAVWISARGRVDVDQAIGVRDRRIPEKDGVDRAEDDGVSPDAESEGQNDRDRKGASAQQAPERVSAIATDIRQHGDRHVAILDALNRPTVR
jgi:hypothetical protein